MTPAETIAYYVIETLPPNIPQRRELLEALTSILPPQSNLAAKVRDIHAALVRHELLQREFPSITVFATNS